MGLLDAIPGLAKHQQKVEPAAAVKVYDREKAYQMIRDASSLLASYYPDGALEWLKANRPDVVRHIRGVEQEIDAIVLSEDHTEFTAALDRYVKFNRRGFELFVLREPVMEQQDDLFKGAA